MTEAEWLACEDPRPMLDFFGGNTTTRNLSLFCCACCLRVSGLLTADYVSRARRAVAFLEQCLAGPEGDREWQAAWEGVFGDAMDAGAAIAHPGEADYYAISYAAAAVEYIRRNPGAVVADFAASAIAYDVLARSGHPTLSRIASEWTPRNRPPGYSQERWARDEEEVRQIVEYRRTVAGEQRIQSAFLRDIFGNPFRPITLDPRWQSETSVALAAGIYAERAFDRMPILADALEDAGCDHAEILSHCRGDGPHVRGCWVVDLVLGKS